MIPAWLGWIVIGAVILSAAYFLPLPPIVKSVLTFVGAALCIVGGVLFIIVILAALGLSLPG